jgi:hypothetical protein
LIPPVTKKLWIAFALFLWTVIVTGLGTMLGLALSEKGVVVALESPDGNFRAEVRSAVTIDPPRHTLVLTDLRSDESVQLESLRTGLDWCETVVWSPGSDRVVFLIRDSRAAVYSVPERRPIFAGELIDPLEQADDKCVRGLTFTPDGNGLRYGISFGSRAGLLATRETLFRTAGDDAGAGKDQF